MNQSTVLRDWMFGPSPLPEWSESTEIKNYRIRAWERLRSQPLQKKHDERWKYFPIESVLSFPTSFESETAKKKSGSALRLQSSDASVVLGFGSEGKIITAASEILPDVSVQPFWQRIEASLDVPQDIKAGMDPLWDFNAAWMDAGIALTVRALQKIEKPIGIELQNASSGHLGNVFQPRINIRLQDQSSATILLDNRQGALNPALINSVLDIQVGKKAVLKLIYLHSGFAGSTRLLHLSASVEASGKFNFVGVSEGGGLGRLESEIHLQGAAAEAEYRMLALGSGDSKFHHQVVVQHAAPDTQSQQVFKSLLTDKAQGEVSSLVHVLREGKNANSRQMIRNILLSPDARAWARPQLQIYADQVQCSHGAATGQFDQDEIFYLTSRGLEPALARLLIATGFLADMIVLLDPLPVRSEMEGKVRQLLQKMLVQSC